MNATDPRVTLSMVVRNEADRYLQRVLHAHRPFIQAAVIIDDGSTDNSVSICREALAGIPLKLIENDTSLFSNEVILRKQQWEETVQTQPEWILNLDADELLEPAAEQLIPELVKQPTIDVFYFRLYDMWNETHYREDQHWHAHNTYRPFLVRYKPNLPYVWRETAQHCGRFPQTIGQFPYQCHPLRIQHYGWASSDDRKRKYERYRLLDPNGEYGSQAQYDSIMDPDPYLVAWVE